MELRPEDKSEREQVEDYIQQFSIESMLDEVLNGLLEDRPSNPYTALSKLIEAKTMPEIVDILVYPTICEGGRGGVEVKILTNLGEFSGKAGDIFDSPAGSETLREYGVAQAKILETIKNIDPRNQSEVDSVLTGLENIDKHIIIATSIAICRAGARHSGVPLYSYLATMGETVEQMPLPVLTAAQLQLGTHDNTNRNSQDILIYPVNSTFFDGALESITAANQYIRIAISEKLAPPEPGGEPIATDTTPPHLTMSVGGCMRVVAMDCSELIDLINATCSGNCDSEMKAALEMSYTTISKFVDDAVLYYPFGEASSEAGAELDGSTVVENLMTLWRSTEIVSVEDPLSPDDLPSLRILKERIGSVMSEVKGDPASTELSYAIGGVGRDESCPLQIVADEAVLSTKDVKKWAGEAVYNAVKIRMSKCGTVTEAVSMAKEARSVGWSVIVGCEENSPEANDDFIADLAVGVSANQFQGGSMDNAEHCCKFNRLLQIYKQNDSFRFVQRDFR